jgi:hypothetical protein
MPLRSSITRSRKTYLALKITDRKPVVFKRDPSGKGGVVSFATSWIFERKKDKMFLKGDTMYVDNHNMKRSFVLLMMRYSEIFGVTWNPQIEEPCRGRRLITRAFVAFGDPVPTVGSETDI